MIEDKNVLRRICESEGIKIVGCCHEWHTAVYFGPDPFPNLDCEYADYVQCTECGQWALQPRVDVGDGESEPYGEPYLFDVGEVFE